MGVLCLVIVFYSVFCVHLVCNHIGGEESAGCFALTVFLMSCDIQCSVALPHGAVGRSAVCVWYFLIIRTCFFAKLHS